VSSVSVLRRDKIQLFSSVQETELDVFDSAIYGSARDALRPEMVLKQASWAAWSCVEEEAG
jgi:hypothetical protein